MTLSKVWPPTWCTWRYDINTHRPLALLIYFDRLDKTYPCGARRDQGWGRQSERCQYISQLRCGIRLLDTLSVTFNLEIHISVRRVVDCLWRVWVDNPDVSRFSSHVTTLTTSMKLKRGWARNFNPICFVFSLNVLSIPSRKQAAFSSCNRTKIWLLLLEVPESGQILCFGDCHAQAEDVLSPLRTQTPR